MSKSELDRIVFYSKYDGTIDHYLAKVESLLNTINLNKEHNINDLLELYNVKLYFDNGLFLPTWDDLTKNNFIAIAQKGVEKAKQHILSINEKTIIDNIESLQYNYRKYFWQLINNLNAHKNLNDSIITQILTQFPYQINLVLACKNIVSYFDIAIKKFLLSYDKTAELLLSNYEQEHSHYSLQYYFPNSLTPSDKEDIISRYLDFDEPNLNYVRLIENSKNLKISAKTKLKAKKISEKLNDKILAQSNVSGKRIQVAFDKDQIEPVKYSNNEDMLEYSYSEKYVDSQNSNFALFHLFASLFNYVDNQGLITLVSKESELDVLEKTFMRSKNEYYRGYSFQQKEYLSHMQLVIFNHYLNRKGNTIELLIESYIGVINSEFNIKNIQLKLPTANTTYLEKIRLLAPELEFLLKQYQAYVDDGMIDFELLEVASNPIGYNEVKSPVQKKYVYINHDKIRILKYCFFSDQCLAYFVKPFENKYTNLYGLLINENVSYSIYEGYQKDIIDNLIGEDHLYVDSEGFINIKNRNQLFIVGLLNKNDVISYWHLPSDVCNEMDKMIADGLLSYENSLFTKQEINYLNFYLNKKEFTNGLDLRNKYLHGTNSSSEKEHEIEYQVLLKIIILVLLKIMDDLIIDKHISIQS